MRIRNSLSLTVAIMLNGFCYLRFECTAQGVALQILGSHHRKVEPISPSMAAVSPMRSQDLGARASIDVAFSLFSREI